MAISGSFAEGEEVVFNDCKVEVDLTPVSSSTYATITSWSTDVAVDGGDVPTSQTFLFQAEGPLILPGNRNAWRVTVSALYTTTSTDPYHNIWLKHEDPATNYASDLRAMNVQWTPQNTTGYKFTTAGGKLVNCSVPMGSAASTEPQIFTFTIEATAINKTAA